MMPQLQETFCSLNWGIYLIYKNILESLNKKPEAKFERSWPNVLELALIGLLIFFFRSLVQLLQQFYHIAILKDNIT